MYAALMKFTYSVKAQQDCYYKLSVIALIQHNCQLPDTYNFIKLAALLIIKDQADKEITFKNQINGSHT